MIFPIGDDNPSSRTPVATYAIIGANCFVFLIANWSRDFPLGQLSQRVALEWGLVPLRLRLEGVGAAPTFLSSLFLHGDIVHLVGNMVFLWITGDNVEDKLGRVRFVIFYLVSGILASATYLLYAGMASRTPLIGASGAIAGVLGCYMVFFPKARIRLFYWFYFFFGTFQVEARWAIGFWIAENLLMWQLMKGTYVTGVAYAAHIGGVGVGVVAAMLLKKHLKRAGGLTSVDRLTGFAREGEGRSRPRRPSVGPPPGPDFVSPRMETRRDDRGFFGLEEAIAENVKAGRIDVALDRYGDYLGMRHAKPLPPWAQIEIAAEFFRRGDYEEALKAYRRYLAHHPSGADAAEAKFRLGMILSRHRGEYFRAREYLLQASMEHPDQACVDHAREELRRIAPHLRR